MQLPEHRRSRSDPSDSIWCCPRPELIAPLHIQVLRSGVELVLVGAPCYPQPTWVEALFSAGAGGSEAAKGAREAAGDGAHPEAARLLRRLGELDPYAYCYDPLALLYELQPDAFEAAPSQPVRVTADGRLERCAEAQAQGRAVEPESVALARYEGFLRESRAI